MKNCYSKTIKMEGNEINEYLNKTVKKVLFSLSFLSILCMKYNINNNIYLLFIMPF